MSTVFDNDLLHVELPKHLSWRKGHRLLPTQSTYKRFLKANEEEYTKDVYNSTLGKNFKHALKVRDMKRVDQFWGEIICSERFSDSGLYWLVFYGYRDLSHKYIDKMPLFDHTCTHAVVLDAAVKTGRNDYIDEWVKYLSLIKMGAKIQSEPVLITEVMKCAARHDNLALFNRYMELYPQELQPWIETPDLLFLRSILQGGNRELIIKYGERLKTSNISTVCCKNFETFKWLSTMSNSLFMATPTMRQAIFNGDFNIFKYSVEAGNWIDWNYLFNNSKFANGFSINGLIDADVLLWGALKNLTKKNRDFLAYFLEPFYDNIHLNMALRYLCYFGNSWGIRLVLSRTIEIITESLPFIHKKITFQEIESLLLSHLTREQIAKLPKPKE